MSNIRASGFGLRSSTFRLTCRRAPDLNPMFLEKRVYQGSSGKIYPLPFTDRIADTKTDRAWTAVWLEMNFSRSWSCGTRRAHPCRAGQNQRLRFRLSPNGHQARPGRPGWAVDFRRNRVQLAATSSSGHVFAADFAIEEHAGGSKTVWLSDHDPICRMKGMHGVCLHPDRAVLD